MAYESIWSKMKRLGELDVEQATDQAVSVYGDDPTPEQVAGFYVGPAAWLAAFDEYNKSIGGALGELPEQPQDIQGRDEEIRLLQAVLERPITPVALLLAEAGTGKALASDTQIPAPVEDGYIAIGDLKVGDSVYDDKGRPARVLGVYPQGEMDAYEVVFKDGSTVVCNDEHLWIARTFQSRQDEGIYNVLPLYKMMENGIVADSGATRYYIPRNGAVERDAVELPIDPYALGALIGDGCLTAKGALAFSSKDEEVVAYVADGLDANGYVRNPRNYCWYFGKSGRYARGDSYIQKVELKGLLGTDERVFDTKIGDRRIPKKYLLASIDQRMELLRGLMDTDGSVIRSGSGVRATFATSSEGLADDFVELCDSLGLRVSLAKRRRAYRDHVECTVNFMISDEDKLDLFKLSRKRDVVAAALCDESRVKGWERRYDDLGVVAVNKLDRMFDMTCIRVDSPNRAFQCTKRHIVTHNTAMVEEFVKQSSDGRSVDGVLNRHYMLMALRLGELSALPVGEMQSVLATIFGKLKSLEDDARLALNDPNIRIVLFIDEVHMMVTIFGPGTKIGGDVLKDMLARCPIRVVAATTRREYDSTIAVDKPLAERFKSIELRELGPDIVKSISKNWWEKVAPDCPPIGDDVVDYIIRSNRAYRPDSAEPRKTLDILEDMVSYCRRTGNAANLKVAAKTFHDRLGIDTEFNIDAKKIYAEIERRIKGQPHALHTMKLLLYATAFKTKQNANKPIFTALFTGSTGTGKTETTKAIAESLYPGQNVIFTVNCPDYASNALEPAFRKLLGERLRHTPNSVVLLDEFEKAAPAIHNAMLSILDEGIVNFTVSNREGRDEVNSASLRDAIVIATTNAGENVFDDDQKYNRGVVQDGREDVLDHVEQAQVERLLSSLRENLIANGFRPEMLGRFDQIVPYRALSESTSLLIIERKLDEMIRDLRESHGIEIIVNPPVQWDPEQYSCLASDVVVYVAFKKAKIRESKSGGARALARQLETSVFYAVVQAVMENPGRKRFRLGVEGATYHDDPNTGERYWTLNLETEGRVTVDVA